MRMEVDLILGPPGPCRSVGMTHRHPRPRHAPVVPGVRLAVDDLAPHINRAMNALDAASRKSASRPRCSNWSVPAPRSSTAAPTASTPHQGRPRGGESERRLYALPVWRETPFFTARERAALGLTEAVTRLADGAVGRRGLRRRRGSSTESSWPS